MNQEPEGPHNDFCPLRRPLFWRKRYDPFARCECSNATLGRMLRGEVRWI